jgi:hypothetical protein
MIDIGVALVDRGENGTRYTLTRDSDGGITGYVEVTGALYNVRNYYDEPIMVGSPKYQNMVGAVRSFIKWEERHGIHEH